MSLQIEHVTRDPKRLRRLEVNARFMTKETYDRLVANIATDGVLTSWPLIWRGPEDAEGEELILSGNHRCDAAVDAGLTEIDCILLDAPDLSRAQQIALQLSHNAIAGDDDTATLRVLYQELDEINWRDYAGLDDKTLKLLDDIDPESLSEANLDYQSVQVLFLPPELERAKKSLKDAMASGPGERWVATRPQYEHVLDALETSRGSYHIGNTAAAFGVILDVFESHLADLRDGSLDHDDQPYDEKQWVPVETVLATRRMPAGAAGTVVAALKRAQKGEDVNHAWQALELICADYLAGS